MEAFPVVLVMLLAVATSGAITRMLPVPNPLPLVQIALGAAIAGVAELGVRLDPDIFFLLFFPPLLFLDGARIPKESFFRDLRVILQLAVGLVFTVLGVGLFIHWMMPTVPQYRAVTEIERQLTLVGIKAEREEVFRRARGRHVNDEIVHKLIRELDLLEARLTR